VSDLSSKGNVVLSALKSWRDLLDDTEVTFVTDDCVCYLVRLTMIIGYIEANGKMTVNDEFKLNLFHYSKNLNVPIPVAALSKA
jgi:hypothetical protein